MGYQDKDKAIQVWIKKIKIKGNSNDYNDNLVLLNYSSVSIKEESLRTSSLRNVWLIFGPMPIFYVLNPDVIIVFNFNYEQKKFIREIIY